jgi:hypothetical protein
MGLGDGRRPSRRTAVRPWRAIASARVTCAGCSKRDNKSVEAYELANCHEKPQGIGSRELQTDNHGGSLQFVCTGLGRQRALATPTHLYPPELGQSQRRGGSWAPPLKVRYRSATRRDVLRLSSSQFDPKRSSWWGAQTPRCVRTAIQAPPAPDGQNRTYCLADTRRASLM